MAKIARIAVFASLGMEALGAFLWFWRFGRSHVVGDLCIWILLIGLMFKNAHRWVYAVGFIASLSLLRMVAGMVLEPQGMNRFIVFELVSTVVLVAAPVCMIIARRRSAGAPIVRPAYARFSLIALLILTAGALSQVTWGTWHAAYISPMAMDGDLSRWQVWLLEVSLGWQMNFGLWRSLLSLALIVIVDAHVRSQFFGARLYLAFYLSAIVVISAVYLAVR